jgi:multiple sugar transport system substrate-binding protein
LFPYRESKQASMKEAGTRSNIKVIRKNQVSKLTQEEIMKDINRRSFLKLTGSGAAAAAAGGFLATAPFDRAAAASDSYKPMFKIEDGAQLKLLRWTGFVDSDDKIWNKNSKAFTDATGVPVQIQYLTWTEMQPKSALAAQLGAGPDVIMGWYDTPFIFSDRLVDVSDVAEHLGSKYGGWYDVARSYGYDADQKRWIAVPVGGPGNAMTYRQSWIEEAGHNTFPKDMDGFLDLCRKLNKKGHPLGLPLGHAVGDANSWTYWVLWGFGGKTVGQDNQVVINSKETREALKYAKALHETMISGVSSWLDPNNNRAFLSGKVSVVQNGISVWYVAQNKFKDIADDVRTAPNPIGPVGHGTTFNLFTQAFVFKYSQYPNAAREYLRFMLEKPQTDPWVTAMKGYVTPALKGYADLPVWTSNPNITPYRDVFKGTHFDGWAGSPGKEAARALHEFIVVDMFADVCVKDVSPGDAAKNAEKRLKAIYS